MTDTEITETTMRPLALVTGASRGIGPELADQFAQHGYNLLINAEDARLENVATTLRSRGTEVTTVRADLRTIEGIEKVHRAVLDADRPLEAVAFNAGVGRGGAFLDNDIADEIEIIDLTITSIVRLAKRLLRDMASRGKGRVLITSQVASTVPGSSQAVYRASNSFLRSFAEALQNELDDTGLTVISVMPGTDPGDDPVQIAKQGFEALMKGRSTGTAGGG